MNGDDVYNSQTFVAKALKILKPSFDPRMIVSRMSRELNEKIDSFPVIIKETLETLQN